MNTDTGLRGQVDITESVIGAAFSVSNELGIGFLEKVYENAMVVELKARQHGVEQQKPIDVWYKGHLVGVYIADLLVDDSVVVELKVAPRIERLHRSQCLNYLRSTRLETGLVINFGTPRVEVQRVRCSDP